MDIAYAVTKKSMAVLLMEQQNIVCTEFDQVSADGCQAVMNSCFCKGSLHDDVLMFQIRECSTKLSSRKADKTNLLCARQ